MITPAETQTLWAEHLLAALRAAGVSRFVVSPGSRSTPLAVAALNHHAALTTIIIDERSAGFFALGAARATHTPVALICTSGSAGAHYLPAIVEAQHAMVPLVIITADRPPELHHAMSPQTVPQADYFGRFVVAALQLGVPEPTPLAFRAMQRQLAHFVAMAQGPQPGPVHINVPLRKPLEPAPLTSAEGRTLAQAITSLAPTYRLPARAAAAQLPNALCTQLHTASRLLVVVGPLAHVSTDERDAIAAFAASQAAAVLAELGSGLRLASDLTNTVDATHLDVVLPLAHTALAAPEVIIHIGNELVCGAWVSTRAHMVAQGAALWTLSLREPLDPGVCATGTLLGDLAATLRALQAALPPAPPTHQAARQRYRAAWRELDQQARRHLEAALEDQPEAEGNFVRAALAQLPAKTTVLLGNSLPIRTANLVTPALPADCTVLTQRGANGIDGMLAAAIGSACAQGPTLVLIGDVTCAHDIGSLAVLQACPAPVLIVVIDNQGGHIFDALPIAHADLAPDVLREGFITPPALDLLAIAQAFGVRAQATSEPAELGRLVQQALAHRHPSLLIARCTPTGALDVLEAARAMANHIPPKELP